MNLKNLCFKIASNPAALWLKITVVPISSRYVFNDSTTDADRLTVTFVAISVRKCS